MRLGQVKRNHNIETSKIVAFLKKQGIEISEHPNSKLTDEQLALVLDNLAPKIEEVPTSTESIEEPKSKPKKSKVVAENSTPEVGEVIEVKKEVKKKPAKKSSKNKPNVYSALGDDENQDVEVIKAPKQELEGLKVLGKIELPEKELKEETPGSETEESQSDPQSDVEENTAKEPDPLDEVHPSKRAKVKAKEKLIEVEAKELVIQKKKKKKKEKSIAEKVAEQKAQEQKKKKKANPHRHIKKAGLQAQRIEVSDDGTILPRNEKVEKVEKRPGLFARIWKWFNH